LAESNSTSEVADVVQRVAFDYVRTGNRRATFDARLMHADDEMIILSHEAQPSRPLQHDGQVVMAGGYSVVWFLFKGQSYDVGRFYRPDGVWTGYYVDILEPVEWVGDDPRSITPLIDLELDLWIAPDLSHQILDEDEFEDSVRRGDLTSAQESQARSTLSQLMTLLEKGSFPPPVVRDYAPTLR
jgi:predicted RNA-binding protein associated with RNAse of E/G family